MNDTTRTTKSGGGGTPSRLQRIVATVRAFIGYCTTGVWIDTRRNWRVSAVKTLNLTVRSFMNPDFQNLSAAMTYRTVLAIVPILALLFAVCRGFGFEKMLTEQLFSFFPSQHQAIATAMRFVDSYLAQASEGIFVGVGIVFLLWTVISLLSNVEDSFNSIWNVKTGRTFWRKITDYLGIFIVLPTLIICSSGITLVLDTTMRRFLPFEALTPLFSVLFELLSVALTWLFFTGVYMLIPNTKVRFRNAFIAGALAGTAYLLLQWLFVSGQMYVSKYNAIYGSFSFLPLLLLWLQLVWLFTFIGATVCYALQNFDRFNYQTQIRGISLSYYRKVTVAVVAVVAKRFQAGMPSMNALQLSATYGFPLRMAEEIVRRLVADGVLVSVLDSEGRNHGAVQPAVDLEHFTLGTLLKTFLDKGYSDFIPDFDKKCVGVVEALDKIDAQMIANADEILLTSLEIDGL